MDDLPPATGPGDPPERHLRLVWSNPNPPRPVNLAVAIQRHLAGLDGLEQEEFLRRYSGSSRRQAGIGVRAV